MKMKKLFQSLKVILQFISTPFPSPVRVTLYKMMGAKIMDGATIRAFSIVLVKNLIMEPGARIRPFVVIVYPELLHLKAYSAVCPFALIHGTASLKVGVHSLGYVAETREQAIKEFFPGYAEMFTKIGRERGWPPVTMSHFESQIGPTGALVVGNVEEVAEKVLRHSEALGGLSRFSFQLDVAGLSHKQLLHAIELIGKKVSPRINK